MTELTPEQEAAIAGEVLNPKNPVLDLGLSQGDEDESGGGALANAFSTAREALETCAGCIRAHLQKVSNCFGGRQNS